MVAIAKALLLMYNAYYRDVIPTQHSKFYTRISLEPNSRLLN